MSHRRQGLYWAMSGRVRLAEALHPAELAGLLDALNTPEGVERACQELEWAQEAGPKAEKARAAVRSECEGENLLTLETEAKRLQGLTRPGSAQVAAGDMERGRIIRLMRATRWPVYRQERDPEA